jgi:hypothetical protein
MRQRVCQPGRVLRHPQPVRTVPAAEPTAGADPAARRAIVPARASRSLWFAAAWTGAGAAATAAVAGIAAVAITWLPASGASGHTTSTLKAGLLTFLAALHGGITVAGAHSSFVPLGLTLLVALVLYRAGAGLGDVAETLEERDPVRLALAAGVQCLAFTTVCVLLALNAGLGTSSAPPVGVGGGALVLSALAGGFGVARASTLGDTLRRRWPEALDDLVRPALAAVCTYLGAGALLVAASLLLHHAQVGTLARQVGDGWSGGPVLLLGALAVPNAVVAGASYLAGPGFTVGSGTHVGLSATPHGVLPAFPVLGALPAHAAGPAGWSLAVATALCAGWVAVRVLPDRETWRALARDFALVALTVGVALGLLAWQAGGGVGTGRLATVGASPWRLALATGCAVLVTQWAVMGALAAREWLKLRRTTPVVGTPSVGSEPVARAPATTGQSVVAGEYDAELDDADLCADNADNTEEAGELAG